MARHSYKTALRAKGIKPIPPARKLRSSLTTAGDTIDATRSAMKELGLASKKHRNKLVFRNCRVFNTRSGFVFGEGAEQ
jgi:hypothetical protein